MPEDAGELTGLDDFDRIVASLNKNRVEFLIVGGYAVIFLGHVRNTKDLDIFIRRAPENARRAVAALEEIGFACPELTPELFEAGKCAVGVRRRRYCQLWDRFTELLRRVAQ